MSIDNIEHDPWSGQPRDVYRRPEEELRASLRRVCDSLATFVRESADPGAEALAALHEARRLL